MLYDTNKQTNNIDVRPIQIAAQRCCAVGVAIALLRRATRPELEAARTANRACQRTTKASNTEPIRTVLIDAVFPLTASIERATVLFAYDVERDRENERKKR